MTDIRRMAMYPVRRTACECAATAASANPVCVRSRGARMLLTSQDRRLAGHEASLSILGPFWANACAIGWALGEGRSL